MRTIRNKPKRTPAVGRPLVKEVPELLPIDAAPPWHWWLAALVVVAASVGVYWPTLDNGFINWDDFDYLTKNNCVAERGGLAHIWNPAKEHEQFYPMVFSSFWLEHKFTLWRRGEQAKESYEGIDHLERGFEPWVHHLTNLILHALCAALVVWLLRLLGVRPWVAWLTAALFAVHPINVASVAWAAERKNVLSGAFYLLSLILYVRATRRWSWISYGACLLLYVAALLSKSAMLTLPATAIMCDRLIERRWRWQSWTKVAPMLALGMVSAYVTKVTEAHNAGVTMVPLDLELRPFAAAGAIWFYIGKLLVPYHFPGVYSRWDLRGQWLLFTCALAALPLAAWLIWKVRRRLPGQALWGLGHFVVSLSPMLGLVAFNYTQFSFVADHFVYLSSVGVFVCVALAADALRRRLGADWKPALITGLACAVLAGLGTFSYRQNRDVWTDGQSFWEYTLKLNPKCWPGQYNLGNIYRRRGTRFAKAERQARDQDRTDEADRYGQEKEKLWTMAAERYGLASEAKDDLYQAHNGRAETLELLGRIQEAIPEYRAALKLKPRHPGFHLKLASLLERTGDTDEAAEHYQAVIGNNARGSPQLVGWLAQAHVRLARLLTRDGRFDEAITLFGKALAIKPDMPAANRGLESARRAREQNQAPSAADQNASRPD